MKQIEVVAGIIRHNNQILCTQRDKSKNKEVSFKWEFPGGKIEPGETHSQALLREIREELNMNINIDSYFMEINYSYATFQLKMYIYLCSSNNSTLELNVHKDYKWLTIEELHSLNWAPADAPIIEKLITSKEIF